MKYNILVCDDNKIELKINATYLRTFAKLYKIEMELALFSDGAQVLEYIEDNRVDIAFLDIDMGEGSMNGIQIAGKLLEKNRGIVTVFITGEMVTVPEVFAVRAFDYIQKPTDSEKFKVSFVRAIKQAARINSMQSTSTLLITVDNLKKKIRQSNIIYVERELARSKIILGNKEIFYVYETIKSLEERLDDNFHRISQSVIVNLACITEVSKGQVIMSDGSSFSIGRAYNKEFKEVYRNRSL